MDAGLWARRLLGLVFLLLLLLVGRRACQHGRRDSRCSAADGVNPAPLRSEVLCRALLDIFVARECSVLVPKRKSSVTDVTTQLLSRLSLVQDNNDDD